MSSGDQSANSPNTSRHICMIHMQIYVHMCICMYTHVYACVCVCMYIHVQVNVSTHVYMYIHIYVYVHVYKGNTYKSPARQRIHTLRVRHACDMSWV